MSDEVQLDKAKLRRLATVRKAQNKARKVHEYYDDLYKQLTHEVYENMLDAEIESASYGGVRVTPYKKEQAYIDDEGAFIEWAKRLRPDLIKDEVRRQLLNELARQRMDDQEALPPGVKFVPQEKLSITKA